MNLFSNIRKIICLSEDIYGKLLPKKKYEDMDIHDYEDLAKSRLSIDRVFQGIVIGVAVLSLSILMPNVLEKAYEQRAYQVAMDNVYYCIKEGTYEEAINILDKVDNLKTVSTKSATILKADVYTYMDKYAQAYKCLKEKYSETDDKAYLEKYKRIEKEKSIIDYNMYVKIANTFSGDLSEDNKIDAYTKAIDAKPEESKPYLEVVKIYVKNKEYEKAINLLNNGIQMCNEIQGDVADKTKILLSEKIEEIDKLLSNDEYKKLYLEIIKAYKAKDIDTLEKKCNEAKKINPNDYRIYLFLAKAYVRDNNYKNAIVSLNEGINILKPYVEKKSSTVITNRYNYLLKYKEKVVTIQKYVNNYSNFYKNLYGLCTKALSSRKFGAIEKVLVGGNYTTMATSSNVTYYNSLGRFEEKVSRGLTLAIYKNQYLYYGNWKDSKKNGLGFYMASSIDKGITTTYVYVGQWKNNYPNGSGTIYFTKKEKGNTIYSTCTKGKFKNGYEHGKMTIEKYYPKKYEKNVLKMKYTAQKGVPKVLKDKKGKVITTGSKEKVIGYYYLGKIKKEVVALDKKVVWRVQGLRYSK